MRQDKHLGWGWLNLKFTHHSSFIFFMLGYYNETKRDLTSFLNILK